MTSFSHYQSVNICVILAIITNVVKKICLVWHKATFYKAEMAKFA